MKILHLFRIRYPVKSFCGGERYRWDIAESYRQVLRRHPKGCQALIAVYNISESVESWIKSAEGK